MTHVKVLSGNKSRFLKYAARNSMSAMDRMQHECCIICDEKDSSPDMAREIKC